jgi:periplasmic protein TonB
MTAAPLGPSHENLFSTLSGGFGLDRERGEAFLLSLLAQVLVVILFALLPTIYIFNGPKVLPRLPSDLASQFPVVFRGPSGGGGGTFDKLPPSRGVLPAASVQQLAPLNVMHPTAMPKLPVQESVELAPEIKLIPGTTGDPWAISKILSNGPGGPGGAGEGCCDGVGPGSSPGAGPGSGGRYIAGVNGVSLPRPIYSPEPSFSDEARKTKTQGNLLLLVTVGTDGHPHDIRVQNSLGMGLDEKAVEAVRAWRFVPAMYLGKPVEVKIAVEVDFHLF